MQKIFLTASWKNLILANYVIDPLALKAYLPAKTELDLWQGKCYISLVGFMFCNTKVLGIKIPFHQNFEEVNLRFYVRYKEGKEWKRGVVFIKEIVPKPAITFVANTLYKEHYTTMPMQHEWLETKEERSVHYAWQLPNKEWNSLSVKAALSPQEILAGTEADFITEHYWGYTKIGNATAEYQVEHPSWRIFPVREYNINCTASLLYPKVFGEALANEPLSVFLAEGSDIIVRKGRRI